MKVDFKKTEKELYNPKGIMAITIPKMQFIMIEGKGNPNTSEEYKHALETLYGLSYAIKMANKEILDYVMPPLECLYYSKDGGVIIDILNKNNFAWTSMIRQPDFVTSELFEIAKTTVAKKKPGLDLSKAIFAEFDEGLCVQSLHIGSYDDEPITTEKIEKFIKENGYVNDFTDKRRHHEIYLSDPRKTASEKLKTIIRYPVKRISE